MSSMGFGAGGFVAFFLVLSFSTIKRIRRPAMGIAKIENELRIVERSSREIIVNANNFLNFLPL